MGTSTGFESFSSVSGLRRPPQDSDVCIPPPVSHLSSCVCRSTILSLSLFLSLYHAYIHTYIVCATVDDASTRWVCVTRRTLNTASGPARLW